MKKLCVLLMLAFILFGATNTFGATQDMQSGTLSIVAPASYSTIESGYSSLHDNGDGTVTIYGYTRTYFPVDQVGIAFNLQYYSSSGEWINLRTYTYDAFDSSEINRTLVVPVSRGYSYRLFTEHYAYDNGLRESGVSMTGGVYVQ